MLFRGGLPWPALFAGIAARGGVPLPAFATDYDAGYTLENVTESASADPGPTGATAVDLWTETAANANHSGFEFLNPSAGAMSIVFYLKAAGRGFGFVLASANGGGATYTVVVNLTTGAAIGTATVGAPTGTSYTVLDAGSGWWRVAVTADHSGGTFVPVVGLSNSATPAFNANGAPTYLGDGVSGILLAR